MSNYDLSLDDIIRSKKKAPQKQKGVGRSQRPPMRARGRAKYIGQVTTRMGTLGRGGGGKAAQLTSNDLRLTRLGLSTKNLTGKSPSKTPFDLRQKITARSGASQNGPRPLRDEVKSRTFRRALTDTVSQGRVTKPIEVDPKSPPRSGRGIKVTIKGLGRKSDPVPVDRRDRNREQELERTSFLNQAIRARDLDLRRKESRYEEHDRHRPGLLEEEREMVHYKTRDKPAREELFLTTGTRLVVSNLHPNVSDRDIIELFSAVGDLQSACFIDNGVAEVIYYRSGDADTAFKRYHNRNLDGQ
jgi:hypothetical protein